MEWSRTGSKYDGRTKDRRMHGVGTYTFPTGSIYHGEFRDGEFHGSGTLAFRHGGKFVGEWRKGIAVEGRYIFADGLAMDDACAPYCLPNRDRRFQTERIFGLKPAGRCQQTNKDPPVTIPKGMLDEGKGFFDPKTSHIVDYNTLKFIDTTGPDTHNWVKNSCRKGWDEVVGFNQKDQSRPHPSDRSTWPPEKEGEVDLPLEFQRCVKITDRPPPVALSSMRDSDTQMARAVSGLGNRRRINDAAAGAQKSLVISARRRHRDASLCSESTSGSEFCDGFNAVRRCPSGDVDPEKKTRGQGEEEEKRSDGAIAASKNENETGGNENAAAEKVEEEEQAEGEEKQAKKARDRRSFELMLGDIYPYRPSWVADP